MAERDKIKQFQFAFKGPFNRPVLIVLTRSGKLYLCKSLLKVLTNKPDAWQKLSLPEE